MNHKNQAYILMETKREGKEKYLDNIWSAFTRMMLTDKEQ